MNCCSRAFIVAFRSAKVRPNLRSLEARSVTLIPRLKILARDARHGEVTARGWLPLHVVELPALADLIVTFAARSQVAIDRELLEFRVGRHERAAALVRRAGERPACRRNGIGRTAAGRVVDYSLCTDDGARRPPGRPGFKGRPDGDPPERARRDVGERLLAQAINRQATVKLEFELANRVTFEYR
jgi:hypothetical protein